MFYNDLKDHLTSVKLIKLPTIQYCIFQVIISQIIENTLNLQIQNLYKFLAENELIINLKPGKTEAMLFGSSKRLAKNPEQLRLTYNGTDIYFTKRYKYLGTIVDPSLILNDDFMKSYKKASSRIKMFQNFRNLLTLKAGSELASKSCFAKK